MTLCVCNSIMGRIDGARCDFALSLSLMKALFGQRTLSSATAANPQINGPEKVTAMTEYIFPCRIVVDFGLLAVII